MVRKHLRQLHKGDTDRRRSSIMAASRSKVPEYLPHLLARLNQETDQGNRRHIVRAIGNIGSSAAVKVLVELLGKERGLILGDLANALGRLRSRSAMTRLLELQSNQVPWIAQQARWALKNIRGVKHKSVERK